jgi:hypothetical protein
VNMKRFRYEIRARFVDSESNFGAGVFRVRAPIGFSGKRDRSLLPAGKHAVESALRKGTTFLTELPLMALSHGEHATTAFAGR